MHMPHTKYGVTEIASLRCCPTIDKALTINMGHKVYSCLLFSFSTRITINFHELFINYPCFRRPLRQAQGAQGTVAMRRYNQRLRHHSTDPFDKLREHREHRELKGLAELDKLNMFCGKNVHKGKKVKKRLRVKFELLVYIVYCMHTN